MHLLGKIRERASKKAKKIALPEAEDARVLKAAQQATSIGLAKIVLVGDEKRIKDAAAAHSIKLDGIEIVDPAKSKQIKKFGETFYGLRKHKGITEKEAEDAIRKSPLFYAAMMTRFDEVDGFIRNTRKYLFFYVFVFLKI